MAGYFQVPQCSTSATWGDIIDTGFYLFDSGRYRRYVAMPEIGVPFENNAHLNQHCFKVNYYQEGALYWVVLGTLSNENTTLTPACYSADDDGSTRSLIGDFENDKPGTLLIARFAFANNYQLPPGASLFSSLEECKNAMMDGDWKYKPKDTDPYGKGGSSSGIGGGTGTFDGTGDNVDIPGLPTLSAAETGFITLFNPSISNLKALASYMWSSPLFDVAAWKKIFADPMDAILGLSIVPVNVPTNGSGEVTVGNISTGISMPKAASQYVEVDCGTLNVQEYWGAYLDYDPYTKAELYLPYCGIHPISVDDIMGKAVHVAYHVDILSGACCAYVKCGSSVLYTFIGQCSSSIPITGDNWTNVINGVISAAVSVGSMVATGGASAPTAIPSLATTAVNSMKPSIEKSGAMGGTGGMLAIQTPYLILTRPNQAVPSYQNKFTGYPSFITEDLSALSGYTEIEYVHLENISATENELSEIENLLKGGVIF